MAIMLRSAGIAFLTMILALPANVWAQAAPTPSVRNAPKPVLGIMIMIVLAVVTIGVSMISSKRGHQD